MARVEPPPVAAERIQIRGVALRGDGIDLGRELGTDLGERVMGALPGRGGLTEAEGSAVGQ